MGDANGSPVLDVGEQAQAAAAKIEAAARELHAVASEVREVRHAATDAVLGAVKRELRAAEESLRAAEASLRSAGERIEEVASEVLRVPAPSGNQGHYFPPISLTQVTNLLHLDRYPKHKKALKEWRRREADLSSRVSRREIRSGDVTNQIFNIIGWYAVFLGVVLTAVSQLTQTAKANSVPVCGKIWFPILLTGFGTVVTICGIIYKFTILKSLEITIQSEKQITAELQDRVSALQSKGPRKFSFSEDTNDLLRPISPKSFWIDKILVILALLALSVIFGFSYFAILCDTWTIRRWDNGIYG